MFDKLETLAGKKAAADIYRAAQLIETYAHNHESEDLASEAMDFASALYRRMEAMANDLV